MDEPVLDQCLPSVLTNLGGLLQKQNTDCRLAGRPFCATFEYINQHAGGGFDKAHVGIETESRESRSRGRKARATERAE